MSVLYPSAARWGDLSMQFIEAAAAANGMHPERLLQMHTTYILRANGERRDLLSLSDDTVIRCQASMALYLHNKVVWGCAACMREDLKRLCFSYWRRSHQVPGRFLCPKHRCPLVPVEDRTLLPGGPAHSEPFIAAAQQQEDPYCAETPDTVFVVTILDAMIERFHRPTQRAAVAGIRQGLLAKGIDPKNSAARSSLQSGLTEHFDIAWLESVSSKLGSRHKSLAKKIERVLNPRVHCPAVDVAIVARLAFTDIGAALRAFGLQAEQPPVNPMRMRLAT